MIAFVYDNPNAPTALAAAVDASLSYPTPDGLTQTYATVIAHPDGTRWAYLADETTTGVAQAQSITVPAPETLDDSWFPIVDPHGGG